MDHLNIYGNGSTAATICRPVTPKTHHASPYFPFLSSGLSLSPEKQKQHDIVRSFEGQYGQWVVADRWSLVA